MSYDMAMQLLYLADVATGRLMRTRWRYDPAVCDLRAAVDAAYAEHSRGTATMSDEELARLFRGAKEE